MTTTFKYDLDRVKVVDQHDKHLGQRSSGSKVVQMHTQTRTHTHQLIAILGALK